MAVAMAIGRVNFYSRASCEARLGEHMSRDYQRTISTHAPHARRGTL